MKTTLLLASLLFCLSMPAAAGPGEPSAEAEPMYDLRTIQTIAGTVERVETMPTPGMGVHLVVLTGTAHTPVHLGPAWYLREQGFPVEEGDNVVITGSLVTLDDQPTLIAAQVRKGDKVLTLRDETGRPRWAGMRGKRGS